MFHRRTEILPRSKRSSPGSKRCAKKEKHRNQHQFTTKTQRARRETKERDSFVYLVSVSEQSERVVQEVSVLKELQWLKTF